MFHRINGFFEEINRNKYLTIVSTNERKDKIKKYEELWIKIRDLIRSVTKKWDDYDEKYIKTSIQMINYLQIKTIQIVVMVIFVRDTFYENDKYYSQVFLDECLYKIQKCYVTIELTFQRELISIKQVHPKSVIFVIIGIS